jgi:hypothetical protein
MEEKPGRKTPTLSYSFTRMAVVKVKVMLVASAAFAGEKLIVLRPTNEPTACEVTFVVELLP